MSIELCEPSDAQKPVTDLLQPPRLLIAALSQQRGDRTESVEQLSVVLGSFELPQLGIQGLLESSALQTAAAEGVIGLREGQRRKDQRGAPGFAQLDEVLARRSLLLKQRDLEHEVRFGVDPHAAASYSIWPCWIAAARPESLRSRDSSAAERARSLSQEPTTISKAKPLMASRTRRASWR